MQTTLEGGATSLSSRYLPATAIVVQLVRLVTDAAAVAGIAKTTAASPASTPRPTTTARLPILPRDITQPPVVAVQAAQRPPLPSALLLGPSRRPSGRLLYAPCS